MRNSPFEYLLSLTIPVLVVLFVFSTPGLKLITGASMGVSRAANAVTDWAMDRRESAPIDRETAYYSRHGRFP